MYPKNAATPPRISIGAVVQISDGAVQTSGVSVGVTPEGGSESAGGGTLACLASGIWTYVPTQAETNYSAFVVSVYKTGCIPATVTVVTTLSATAGQAVCADTQKVDLNTVKTQTLTCAAGVTVLASVGTAATSTAQTGDSYLIVNHTDYGNAKLVRSTTPANTLSVDAAHKIPATVAVGDFAANSLTASVLATDAVTEIKNAILDEVNTGATHNVKNSVASQIRSSGGGSSTAVVIRQGTCQSGSTATTIKLDSGASATNDIYNGNTIYLDGGVGVGQSRRIVAYNGTTKVATVDRGWIVTPTNTSTFTMIGSPTSILSFEGVAVSGGASTVVLPSTAVAVDNYYSGFIVIESGTGAGQSKEITGYTGSSKTVSISPDTWSLNPSSDSVVAIIPTGGSGTDQIVPPSVGDIAAAILVTPSQKVVTDSSGFVTANVTGSIEVTGDVTLAATQPNYAPAKAGDAMTLTSAYATFTQTMADYLDAAISTRSTFSGGTISGVTNPVTVLSGTITTVTNPVSVTGSVTMSGGSTLSASDVWSYISRTLTGGIGAGAISWTETIRESGGTPIPDADVWVTSDSAGTNVLASGRSDGSGIVAFYLDAGTVYVWAQKSGFNFTNPTSTVVA